MKVLVIGAGGHGQVVADALFQMWKHGREVEIVGFLDDDASLVGQKVLGLKVLGTSLDLPDIMHDGVIVGVGDNKTRRTVMARMQDETVISAIHPSAVLAPDVVIKPGAMILAGAVINPGTVIGEGAIVNTGATIDHHGVVGSFSHIAPGVNLGGEVRIGEGAMVGIGANVVPRVALGDWSVAGAGAVVTRDIPAEETWVGVPARKIY